MPNHAAAERLLPNRALRAVASGALGLALLAAPTAHALDGIELSVEAEPVAEGECGALSKIKYPWLVCDGSTLPETATWENSRRMPRQGDWNEGDAAWGPSLNED